MWETGRLTGLLAGRRGRVAEFNPTPSSCSGAVGDRPGSRAGWQAGWLAGQIRSGQARRAAGQVRSGQGSSGQDRAGQGRAGQDSLYLYHCLYRRCTVGTLSGHE